MKFLSVVLLSLAGLATAKGHEKAANGTMTKGGHHGKMAETTKGQCREVARLTSLMELANNQTKLDEVTHNNATKASAIKAKASAEASTLSTLQSNATLMAACGPVFAADEMRKSCRKMAALEHLDKLVANATALAAATKNNATRGAELQAKASAEAGTLSALQGNATLTQFCSVEKTKQTCHAMMRLQKEVAEAANATWLDQHFKGNQTKIDAFKARAAKAQTKLAAMQGNSTLTSECSSLMSKGTATTAAEAASTSGAASASAMASGMAKSAAGSIQPVAGLISLAAVFGAGVLLL